MRLFSEKSVSKGTRRRAKAEAAAAAAGAAARGWFKPGKGGIYTALRAEWKIPHIKPDGIQAEVTWPEAFL